MPTLVHNKGKVNAKKKSIRKRRPKKGKGRRQGRKQSHGQQQGQERSQPTAHEFNVTLLQDGEAYTADEVFDGPRNLHDISQQFFSDYLGVDIDGIDDPSPEVAEISAILEEQVSIGGDRKWKKVCMDLIATPENVVRLLDGRNQNVLSEAPCYLMWKAAQSVATELRERDDNNSEDSQPDEEEDGNSDSFLMSKHPNRELKQLDSTIRFKIREGAARRERVVREYTTTQEMQEAQRIRREESKVLKSLAKEARDDAKREALRTNQLATALWAAQQRHERDPAHADSVHTAHSNLVQQLDREFPPHAAEMTTAESTEYATWLSSVADSDKFRAMDDDVRQITGMRYLAVNSDFGRKGYYGRVMSGGGNEVALENTLNPVWVRLNFRKEFLVKLRTHPRKWFPIPVGASTDDIPPTLLGTNVPCVYQQGRNPDCVFMSFAAALHYIGLVGCATAVAYAIPTARGQPLVDQLCALRRVMEKFGRAIGRPKQLGKRTKKGNKHPFTLMDLVMQKTIYPTIVVPRAADGGIEHAVTVVDDLVFDATQPYALKLHHHTMDWVCSGRCLGIFTALRFEQKYLVSKGLSRDIKSNW